MNALPISGLDGAEPVPIRPRRLRLLLESSSPTLTVAGVVLAAAGFVLIAVGWFEVSGLTDVALQMPYVVSAALTGLGLIVIGVAGVAIAAKRQETDQRIRKLERLETVLSELGLSRLGESEFGQSGFGPGEDTWAPPAKARRR